MTLSVRDETAADRPAVAATITDAFGDPDVAALWAEVVGDGHARASLVAELDGDVVGHVGLSAAWLDARRRLLEVWMLSPLSVAPARQRRGIGTALVTAAIERARSTPDVPLLVLEGSPDYYGARGFERAADHRLYPPSARTPDRAFQVVLGPAHEEWMTGQCVYPDVWWRHDSAGLRGERLDAAEQALGVADPRPR